MARQRILARSEWFFLLAFGLLVARVVWGMWLWRDLTFGDTSYYFDAAKRHLYEGKPLDLVFSPLYLWYYSSFVAQFQDAFAATILHRIGIILLASSSIYLLARNLLPRPAAWLITAWWLFLPVNWNALYEVHLFGIIPFALGSWAVGFGRHRRLWKGVGLALIWMGALLVRNEFALTVAALTVIMVVFEWLDWRRNGGGMGTLAKSVVILAIPGLLATLAAAFLFQGSWTDMREVKADFAARHALNIAQVYPFGYQQRHPESFPESPWTNGHLLMRKHFGQDYPTFSQAFRANPSAMWEHIAWNFSLLPSSIQLGLFNCYSGKFTPDFTNPPRHPRHAFFLTASCLAILGFGSWFIWRQRGFYLRLASSPRSWSWVALLCMLPTWIVAIGTQRPRPSYLFLLYVLLMLFVAWALIALLRKRGLWDTVSLWSPLIVIATVLVAGPHTAAERSRGAQPLKALYHQLNPFRAYFAGRETVFCSRVFTEELLNYVSEAKEARPRSVALGGPVPASRSEFDAFLAANDINLLFLEEFDLECPAVQEWIAELNGLDAEWVPLADLRRGTPRSMLFSRRSPLEAALAPDP